jgi:SAM-dependent methyltransferase
MAGGPNTHGFWEERAHWSVPQLETSQFPFASALGAVAKGRAILDCGSGAGALSAYLHGRAREVMGIDFTAAMIARAKGFFPHLDFHHGDVLATDLGRQFDVICGIGFLHEITLDDTPALFAFLDRHLAPGGFCWFQENSFFNPVARFLRRRIVGHYGVPKYGSEDETPFDPERWTLYQQRYRYAVRSAETFVTWHRAWRYFVRRGPQEPWKALDRLSSRLPDPVKRNMSYIQHVYLSHDTPKKVALGL